MGYCPWCGSPEFELTEKPATIPTEEIDSPAGDPPADNDREARASPAL